MKGASGEFIVVNLWWPFARLLWSARVNSAVAALSVIRAAFPWAFSARLATIMTIWSLKATANSHMDWITESNLIAAYSQHSFLNKWPCWCSCSSSKHITRRMLWTDPRGERTGTLGRKKHRKSRELWNLSRDLFVLIRWEIIGLQSHHRPSLWWRHFSFGMKNPTGGPALVTLSVAIWGWNSGSWVPTENPTGETVMGKSWNSCPLTLIN